MAACRRLWLDHLEAILKNFTAAQTVKLRIVAGNDGGDAAPSPEAGVVVT